MTTKLANLVQQLSDKSADDASKPITSSESDMLQGVIKQCIGSMDTNYKSAYWAKMTRVTSADTNNNGRGRACPPHLKERWEACGSNKELKNDCFSMFVACGGDIGRMEAMETEIKVEVDRRADLDGWSTLKQVQDDLNFCCIGPGLV